MADELKTIRALFMQKESMEGRSLKKKELAKKFGVSEKTIQRDLDSLRDFLTKYDKTGTLIYWRSENAYQYHRFKDLYNIGKHDNIG